LVKELVFGDSGFPTGMLVTGNSIITRQKTAKVVDAQKPHRRPQNCLTIFKSAIFQKLFLRINEIERLRNQKNRWISKQADLLN
jgi:hypothetical protein